MGCNSSNQVGSDPPNANLPSSSANREEKAEAKAEAAQAALDEAGDNLEKIEALVAAAKAALEAALEEADEDQDKVVALAEAYSNCYAALLKTPGALPPEGFYTSEESIFQALMPRGDGGIAPVKLLSSKWIKDRAAKLKAATTDDERRKLRLPRRQDLERDEPEAFMSVERLKELPRKHGYANTEKAPGRRLVVLLADARAPGPARRAARIVGGGHREGGDGRRQGPALPIRGGDFRRFRLSLQKIPICGSPAAAGRPTSRPRRGRRRRRRRRTRTRRAARARNGRRLASRCRRCRSGTCTRCSRPSSRARCRRVMRASPDMRR